MTSSQRTSVPERKKRRPVTVYDAVAGRAGYEGFLTAPQPSKYRDTASHSTTSVPPEEVLFRRRCAPARYEEDDIYFANRHLKSDQKLPDSDLLKTIHTYASDFYAAATADEDGEEFRSLEETALIAMGILLEEAAKEAVGKSGFLAFLEPSDAGQNTSQKPL